MKNILLLFLAVWVIGCNKEDELEPQVHYDHLYVIQDNPSDSIQHKAYEIYQKYGVPVYFNDTVGKIFVKTNVYGDSVFRYEMLDLAWGFSSYTSADFDYVYMTDPDQQMTGLRIVEDFLERSNKGLWPFSIFITKSLGIADWRDNVTSYAKGAFKSGFRMLYMSGDWESQAAIESLPADLMKALVKEKIKGYTDDLAAFNKVCDKNWYGKGWPELDSKLPAGWECDRLNSDWWIDDATPHEVDSVRNDIRNVIGNWGFVNGASYGSYWTPNSNERDLETYIGEMIKYPKAQFEVYWGAFPLVMKKYNILYGILVNRFGIEL